MRKLRGPKGTFVNIGIRRKGLDASDPDARDARSGQHPEPVGRVHDRRADRLRRVDDFAEHTDEDLGDALETLTKKG